MIKKILIAVVAVVVVSVGAFTIYFNFLRDTSVHKTLYGLWALTEEQFDDNPIKKLDSRYLIDVSGRCEDINIKLTANTTGFIKNNEVQCENALCFGNRDELSFFAPNMPQPVNFKLKMDATLDTLHGTYEMPEGKKNSIWNIVHVKFVRVE